MSGQAENGSKDTHKKKHILRNVGIYIWDGYSYLFDKNLTQHTIISTNFFAPLNGGRSICDWIMDAVNGDIQTYGLDLLGKQY